MVYVAGIVGQAALKLTPLVILDRLLSGIKTTPGTLSFASSFPFPLPLSYTSLDGVIRRRV